MPLKNVTLFYRDGDNYKFSPRFEIDDSFLNNRMVGDEVKYTELGITQDRFHEKIGYPYDETSDHTFVTIEEVN